MSLFRLFVPASFIGFALLFTVNIWDLGFRSTVFPYVAIISILILATVVFVKEVVAIRAHRRAETEQCFSEIPETPELKRGSSVKDTFLSTYLQPSITVALLVAYVYTIPLFGFHAVTFVFLVAVSFVIGISWRQLPLVMIVMGLATVLFYYGSSHLLQIHLP